MKSILAVGTPFGFYGGGQKRNYNTLLEYRRMGLDVYLYLPIGEILEILYNDPSHEMDFDNRMIENLENLENSGVTLQSSIFDFISSAADYVAKVRRYANNSSMAGFMVQGFQWASQENSYISNFRKEIGNIDAVYSLSGLFSRRAAFRFAHAMGKQMFILLQLEPFVDPRIQKTNFVKPGEPIMSRLLYGNLLPKSKNLFSKFEFKKYARSGIVKGILSVSSEPLEMSGLRNVVGSDMPVQILSPAYAFHRIAARERPKKKDDAAAIFYARLVPAKGLLELPYILSRIQKKMDVKLTVCGNFYLGWARESFMKKMKSFGIDVEYQGFLDGESLYRKIAESKVFIYPTHSDSFSMSVMESICLGTSVATYDIPAIRSVFGGLSPVKSVREGDVDSLSARSIDILEMNESDYRQEHSSKEVTEFIEKHKSWRNVAEAELLEIEKLLCKR